MTDTGVLNSLVVLRTTILLAREIKHLVGDPVSLEKGSPILMVPIVWKNALQKKGFGIIGSSS